MRLHDISLGNIKRRKGKMLFLVMGLVIGISTVVTLLSITESMTLNIEERLNQFGANIVMVPKSENLSLNYGGIDVGGINYQVQEFEQEKLADIRTIKNSKNLSIIAPKILGSVTVKDKIVLLIGVVFEEELALKTWWHKAAGTFAKKEDEIMLGSRAADLLGFNVGDTVLVSGKSFKLSAILRPTGTSEDDAVIASLGAAQTLLGKQGKLSMVEISAFCQGCPISEMTLQIAEKFPNAKVTAMKQAVMSKMQSIDMFKSFSLGVSIIVILIGSLLVMVTMMGSVNERTREIGIFRAIGFRRGHIMQIILLEALLLGIIGGILGFGLGNLIACSIIPIVIKDGGFAGINLSLGIISILMAVALSLLASLYPAFKASNMDPSQALRAL
ncbi:ABC transporter permease [Desulfobacula toluolica]|uniref:ABC transporter permease n=1 Tax=Desulfobacula toluolica TaxID=28223 RepID=UPI0002E06D07|nr:FtsX-like permease family protein [Desulfobacula toluolica]